jgi:hypothetical protein
MEKNGLFPVRRLSFWQGIRKEISRETEKETKPEHRDSATRKIGSFYYFSKLSFPLTTRGNSNTSEIRFRHNRSY